MIEIPPRYNSSEDSDEEDSDDSGEATFNTKPKHRHVSSYDLDVDYGLEVERIT
jgi:hypothetical protein